MQADSIKIECEEDGFWLSLTLDEDIPSDLWDALGESYGLRVRIHDCAEALHEQVNLIIGGWLAEGEAARLEWKKNARAIVGESISEAVGYDIDDPKHPDFHSVHADLYDSREGK